MVKLRFRRIAIGFLFACAVASCPSATPAQDLSDRIRNLPAEQAYQKLAHAEIFNFGGIGWGLTITPEEKAFRTLLESPNRIELFKRLLSEANPEGQLYALYGLYQEDRNLFTEEAAKLKSDDGPPERREQFIPVAKGKVRFGSGCILSQRDRRKVIEEIAEGKFDNAFNTNNPDLIFT